MIVAFAFAVTIVLIGLAVAEFIRDSDQIALTDGSRSAYASKSRMYW